MRLFLISIIFVLFATLLVAQESPRYDNMTYDEKIEILTEQMPYIFEHTTHQEILDLFSQTSVMKRWNLDDWEFSFRQNMEENNTYSQNSEFSVKKNGEYILRVDAREFVNLVLQHADRYFTNSKGDSLDNPLLN